MTLIVPDDGADAPRTHALVIGVGGYRHLQGGVEEREQTLRHVGLLRQLTSPPRSALALARWLRDHAPRLRVPLGSVDMLLSLAPGDALDLPAGFAVGATRADIKSAYWSWRARCDRKEGNVALFYFCGHGLEKTEQYLLAEDFGANPPTPWEGAFAFDSTRLAFHACLAQTQCFLIDACRKITSGMLTKPPQAVGLDDLDYTTPECERNFVARAAAKNEEAFGPEKRVSYFTQALLQALGGAAARQGENGWVVDTGGIAAHLHEILRMVRGSENPPDRPSFTITGNAALVDVEMPRVAVTLACDPKEANDVAQLSWHPVGNAAAGLQQVGGPWRFDAEPGMYRAAAAFDGGGFRAAETQVIATPPRAVRNLPCAP